MGESGGYTRTRQLEQGHRMRRGVRRLLPAAAGLGTLVGLIVAAIRLLVYGFAWPHLPRQSAWVALFPLIGLFLSGLILHFTVDDPELQDIESFVDSYHSGAVKGIRATLGRVSSSLTTVGFGAPAGLEGPSLYAGSMTGGWLGHLLLLDELADRRIMLTAGAAAGVAALFKTPVTGVLFALEVPFTDEFAPEALIPTFTSAATAYATVSLLLGPEPLLHLDKNLEPNLLWLPYALAAGLLIGIVGRLFARALRWLSLNTPRIPVPLYVRTLAGGAICAVLALVSFRFFPLPLALGTGYEAITDSVAGKYVGTAALVLLALRGAAILATLGSDAAGGTFVPFVSMGAISGAALSPLVSAPPALLPLLGVAAFVSSAAATPVAAAVFVVETTRAGGYLPYAGVAAAAAYLVGAGRHSRTRRVDRTDAPEASSAS